MTQLSSTDSTCAAQWKMWFLQVFSVIYLTALCGAQTPQSATDVSSSDIPPTSPLPESTTVYNPPVPSLQLKSAWKEFFQSEKVELTCNISGSSDWIISWHRNGVEVQESDSNLKFSQDKSVLTITAGTHNAGNYTCTGRHKTRNVNTQPSNLLPLQVHENPSPTLSKSPNFDKMFCGESVTFTCTISVSSGWEYLWYHNGKQINSSTIKDYTIGSLDLSHNGQYTCKTRRSSGGLEVEFSSKESSLQVSDPPVPSLQLKSAWKEFFQSEKVELTCNIDSSSDWIISWHRNGVKVQEPDSNLKFSQDKSVLTITAGTHNAGNYTCTGRHKTRNVNTQPSNPLPLQVHENPSPTLSKSPNFDKMFCGESVTFTCTISVSSGWEYLWYHNGKQINSSTIKDYTIGSLDLSHNGQYTCKTRRSSGGSEVEFSSKESSLQVSDPPKPSLKLLSSCLDVFISETVEFSCDVGSSEWRFTWYKNDRELQNPNADGSFLKLTSVSKTDEGLYACKAQHRSRKVSTGFSNSTTVTVREIPVPSLNKASNWLDVFPTEDVKLSCGMTTNRTHWTYTWYKDGKEIRKDNVVSIDSDTTTLSISHASHSHRGQYSCMGKLKARPVSSSSSPELTLKVYDKKPKPLMTQQPDVGLVYTGESVTYECKVDVSSGWEYHWLKNGSSILNSSSRLDIRNATVTESGRYWCTATRNQAKYKTEPSDERALTISEIPVPSLKKASNWLDVFPTEDVKLSCGMTTKRSDWTYTWYKDGKEIRKDNVVSIDPDTTTLSISHASHSHRGQYSCMGKLKARSVSSSSSPELTLKVYETKPSVTLTQTPEHKLMHTGDSVSFYCHVNVSTGWEYLWHKDNSQSFMSGPNPTIVSVATKDSGSYKCQVKRGTTFKSDESRTLKLKVEERPKANIVLLTGWSEVFSTDTLMLKCEVQESQNMWNYTWFKEGQSINASYSEKHAVTPQNDPEQSLYTCHGIRTGRPSYSKPSDSFKTKNLLLKRRVLLSISGCIFFGIIAVFLGCIVLRVTRKPVRNTDHPEEPSLFLSMAQLKDRGDAPSPLVDYITDEELNAPAKEEEGNGTICSETTPLTITTQDEAVATENHDKEENNGGLVSFKQ